MLLALLLPFLDSCLLLFRLLFRPPSLLFGTAPLFWLTGMLVTLWLGMQVAPDDEPEPRWKRRNRSQESKRQRRKRRGWSPGCIKSHGFHKRYPLSLRSLGHFVRDAPKLDSQLRLSYLHRFMGELQAYLWQITLLRWKKLRRSPKNRANDAVTRRKGGNTFGGQKMNQKKGRRDRGPKFTTWVTAIILIVNKPQCGPQDPSSRQHGSGSTME